MQVFFQSGLSKLIYYKVHGKTVKASYRFISDERKKLSEKAVWKSKVRARQLLKLQHKKVSSEYYGRLLQN